MKVYISADINKASNPYVSTLTKSVDRQFSDVEWGFGLETFWANDIFDFDIVHIQWPHQLVEKHSSEELKNRLEELKGKGVVIVSTCHNYVPHKSNRFDEVEAYELVYSMCDMMFHLGPCSMEVMSEKNMNATHVLLPHQTYDDVYPQSCDKEESRKHLRLRTDGRYVLCFGLFRNDAERQFVTKVANELHKDGIHILAPSFFRLVKRRNKIKMLLLCMRFYLAKLRYPNIIMSMDYVGDDDVPYYYGAADMALIQRVKILNSGNVPLAFLMGRVVAGPDVGNVGPLLKYMGNPTFNPDDLASVVSAVKRGIALADGGKGEENRKNALANFSSDVIGRRMYDSYVECLSRRKIK